MVGAAAVAAVGSVASGYLGAKAQKSASRQQAAAQNAATAQQQEMFDKSSANLEPFISTGTNAASKLSSLQGLTNSDPAAIQKTLTGLPGYRFNLQQGLKSTQNSAAARGLATSGAALKAASQYATGLADSNYNNYVTGLQNTTSMGANAANGLANTSATVGSNLANTITGAGNAKAAGTLGTANAEIGGLNGLQSAFYTNKILGGSTGSGTNSGLYDKQADANFLANAQNSAFGGN